MTTVKYHQEAGDTPLQFGPYVIDANPQAGVKARAGKALFNADGEAVVHDPVEGAKIGQYTPVFDPDADKKAEAPAKADEAAARKK